MGHIFKVVIVRSVIFIIDYLLDFCKAEEWLMLGSFVLPLLFRLLIVEVQLDFTQRLNKFNIRFCTFAKN